VTVGDSVGDLDRDGDQLPDVIEYALGLSTDFPNLADSRRPFFRELEGTNYWMFSLSRSPAPADSSVGVEFSSNGSGWVPGVKITDTPFLLEFRDPEPASIHAHRMARIWGSRP
jgi:hypothetical protein